MYAVMRTAGKQFRVTADDVISVDMLVGQPGETVAFDEVLMVGGQDGVEVGSPTLSGVRVEAEVVEHTRGPRLIVFKKKRRKNFRRKNGHRQDRTVLKIMQIVTGAEMPVGSAHGAPELASDAPATDMPAGTEA